MGIFQNDFFSLAGQQERLSNVGNTLLAAVGIKKGGVVSNTGVKPLDTVLSAAASHPFITAAVAASAVNPAGAQAAVKAGASAAGKAFSSATVGQKAAVLVSAPIVAGAVASNPGLVAKASDAPGALVNFGSNVGSLAANPSLENLKKTVKENPVVASVVGAGAALGLGIGAAGIASSVATFANTAAVKANTAATTTAPALLSTPTQAFNVAGGSSELVPPPLSASKTPIIPGQTSKRGPSRRRKARKAEPNRISNSIRVYNIDDRDTSDRKVYKGAR